MSVGRRLGVALRNARLTCRSRCVLLVVGLCMIVVACGGTGLPSPTVPLTSELPTRSATEPTRSSAPQPSASRPERSSVALPTRSAELPAQSFPDPGDATANVARSDAISRAESHVSRVITRCGAISCRTVLFELAVDVVAHWPAGC